MPPPSKKAGKAKAQAQASYVAVQLVGFKINQDRDNFYAINTTQETWTIQALPGNTSPYVAWYKEWTGYPVQRNGQKKRDAQWTLRCRHGCPRFWSSSLGGRRRSRGGTAAPTHTQVFFCPTCGYQTPRAEREGRPPPPENEKLKCPYCEKKYTQDNLKTHISTYYADTPAIPINLQLSLYHLYLHIPTTTTGSSSTPVKNQIGKERKIPCTPCVIKAEKNSGQKGHNQAK